MNVVDRKHKSFIYRFDSDRDNPVEEADHLGEMPVPFPGDIKVFKEKSWKVVVANVTTYSDGRYPVVEVTLTAA